MRALLLALLLLDAGRFMARDPSAPAPATTQSTVRPHQEGDPLLETMRQLRAAELSGTPAALEQVERSGELLKARAALAKESMRARSSATSAWELRATEDALELRRSAMAQQLEASQPACARELRLECAEDLLLRLFPADRSDATFAVGLCTRDDVTAARALLVRAEDHLNSPLLTPALSATAESATDATAFRACVLAGLAALAHGEVEAAAAANGTEPRANAASVAESLARADTLLSRAALSELPLPSAMKCLVALARARATNDRNLRARLLQLAQESADSTNAFVARCQEWKSNRAPTAVAFPTTTEPTLRVLAACAEARARDERGESSALIAVPFHALLRGAAASDGDATVRTERVRALALDLSSRFNISLLTRAAQEDAPPLLVALAALHPRGSALLRERRDVLRVAASQTLIASWLSVPLASSMRADGASRDAAATLQAMVDTVDGLAMARNAMEIALGIRRVHAAESVEDERALDAALLTAARRIEDPIAVDRWQLERVDLALSSRWSPPALDRAEELLLLVRDTELLHEARIVRHLEIRCTRLEVTPPRAPAARIEAALAIAKDAALITESLLAPRAALVRARASLLAEKPADAERAARAALNDPNLDDAIAARAATLWLTSTALTGDTSDPPKALAELMVREASVSTALEDRLEQAHECVAAALDAQDRKGAAELARLRLASLTSISRTLPSQENATNAAAAVLNELARGSAVNALTQARAASARWPTDRRLQFLLAESLRANLTTDPSFRIEAFTLLREVALPGESNRDRLWWRAQLAQLEMLEQDPKITPARRLELLARINRLAELDGNPATSPSKSAVFGGAALAQRFKALRAKLSENAGRSERPAP